MDHSSRLPRWGALALTLLLALATACSKQHEDTAPDDRISPKARAYLTAALDLIQKRALKRGEVDWPEVRRTAFTRAAGARKPSGTYPAIEGVLGALGDGHSRFLSPAAAEKLSETSLQTIPGLVAKRLRSGPGYVALPGVQGSMHTYDTYVRQGRDAVAAADRKGACGWVVDLRGNRGGNMDPMFAVVAAILGDGNVGAFVEADGKRTVWTVKGRSLKAGANPPPWPAARPLSRTHPAVAVLTDGRTASAGEAVTVAFRGRPATRSFGMRTSGVPTGNTHHRLSDGAALVLTEAKEADRTGRTYGGPIPPDEEFLVEPQDIGTSRDRALDAATRWLGKQPDCR
ncbi:S41 family peptidase [Streptomyces rapamycinicus]|uniref:Peptidase S41 n=2 Tax=Streptomyces rapamycinicus TaxID=1226757 RepID=A0A0A0NQP3_STRRN|nr:S41 family peptidase [Streptomyces rapamycinicus]AGP59571.1 peptidase S41 [Streptomyces rapamycinicus NRRL 5491]MBB4789279.1 C-terminal processing protease CtpA/Prc [Streptomyces rapamycinicus]RLV77248.1 peptidase S41 [Streptomyces rapamycinicus NRRL 5491]UTO67269.1 S41 family peptidase [Streptomyces rapamycinicus]UTP35227.1 S41 family peptidase [Streptomyces rapamycinicus NRRL 5491]